MRYTMPHLTLEYSSNVIETNDLDPLFSELHRALAEIAGFNVHDCKSRARPTDQFFVGLGGDREAFVHLEIRSYGGKSLEMKKAMSLAALKLLRERFERSASLLHLQITVETGDVDEASHSKFSTSPKATPG
jgi:5-carboxymethyl-2-hydroxymuconate isomerase